MTGIPLSEVAVYDRPTHGHPEACLEVSWGHQRDVWLGMWRAGRDIGCVEIWWHADGVWTQLLDSTLIAWED